MLGCPFCLEAAVPRELTESQLAHRARMAAPPAEFMAAHTFAGEESGSPLYSKEYTWAAMQGAALEWAASGPYGNLYGPTQEIVLGCPPPQRVAAMHHVLATCGVTDQLLQQGGYLNSWLGYVRVRFTSLVRRSQAPVPHLPTVTAGPVPSPDPLFSSVEAQAHVTYTHRVVVDGVEFGVQNVLDRMESIEDSYRDSGAASFTSGGEEELLYQLLAKHAGLSSRGGYHSSPGYDEDKWQAFKDKLHLVRQTTL